MAPVAPPDPQMVLDAVSERYGAPSFCLFFGSHAFGRGDEGSDIDVIAVFSTVRHAYRETFSAHGFLFDAQIHDPETLHYALRAEQKIGFAILSFQIEQALVLPAPCEAASHLKTIAHEVMSAGPSSPLNWNEVRRYVTAALSDLERASDTSERRMMAIDLYTRVVNVHLRWHRQFVGPRHYLVRLSRNFDRVFFESAEHALASLFESGSVSELAEVVRGVLDLIGGPLTEGYRQDFAENCRLPLA